jgi:hypothetical protein
MRGILAVTAALLMGGGVMLLAQEQPAAPPQASRGEGLRDLDAMTFGCAKAGLNAAAREAATAPSQGTYQFSFFRIVSDTHHAAYEVQFKSNYEGEPVLKYCVEIYCQQGWDPKTTKTTVTLMTERPARKGTMTHGAACAAAPARAPATRTVKE